MVAEKAYLMGNSDGLVMEELKELRKLLPDTTQVTRHIRSDMI
jgi:hypothetical protein